jgi:aminoglycoside phosphotransferase (APT) family kinase protein
LSDIDVSDVPGVPAEGLRTWLLSRGLLAESDPALKLTQLVGGASNVTVRVQSGAHDWVLRRPPLRGALPTANDMLREYRLQAALASAGAGLPLATMVDSCDVVEVIGAPFYVMERLTGFAHNSASLAALTDHDVHEVGLALVDVLAQLHSVDPAAVPDMAEFLRPTPYADRQLRRWHGQWERSQKASDLADEPALDRVFEKLAATKPPVPPARVVHGDFGLANVMFDPEHPTRVQAVLDWELAAVGDPLADLGALVAYQSSAGRLMNVGREDPVCHPDLQPALPSVAELAERYAKSSGESVERLDWYVSLAVARLGVIVAGALARLDPTDPGLAERRARTVRLIHELAVAAEAELGQTSGS